MSTTVVAPPRVGPPVLPPCPGFAAHPLLGNGHLQTLASRYLGPRPQSVPSTRHELDLGDGDRLVYLDAAPRGWRAGDPIVLIVHGLGGCAESPYVVRTAGRLVEMGLRAARMNQRGAGVGFGLARGIYHAGRTGDVRAVGDAVAARYPGSPVALLGFSLGGNLVLKLAAEAADDPAEWLDAVLAVNPPIDLAACCEHLRARPFRFYDRHFVRMLRAQIDRLHTRFPDLGPVDWRPVRSLYDFDQHYTAPRGGFAGADDYYGQSSAGPLVGRIECPGLVVHASDDPFIPVEPFLAARFPKGVRLEITRGGGHLGFLGRADSAGDRRWLEARLSRWLAQRWELQG